MSQGRVRQEQVQESGMQRKCHMRSHQRSNLRIDRADIDLSGGIDRGVVLSRAENGTCNKPKVAVAGDHRCCDTGVDCGIESRAFDASGKNLYCITLGLRKAG